MVRLSFYIVAFALLQACVGVSAMKGREFTPHQPGISGQRGNLMRVVQPGWSAPTEVDIVELWGEPDEIAEGGSEKILIYKNELKWRGAILYVVVPVPLLFPWGRNETAFLISGGSVIEATQGLDHESLYGCGPFDGIYICGAPAF